MQLVILESIPHLFIFFYLFLKFGRAILSVLTTKSRKHFVFFVNLSWMGKAAPTLHMILILQVYQAKLLKSLDESGPDPEVFKEL